MELQLAFEKNLKLWRIGYCADFAALGMASFILGPVHVQLSCDCDRDGICEALGSPWTAFRAWISDRQQFGRARAAIA